MNDYKINDIIKVTVTGIQKYGAFVTIDNNYNGLIHISEISNGYVRNINDYLKINDRIYAQIIDIDNEQKKIKLSIKNIDYRNTGQLLENEDSRENGFKPLKEHLDTWVDDKIKEIMDKM